ncbi:MAG TPA: DUF1345 domain-containing protein [Polyangiaceae bacterium]
MAEARPRRRAFRSYDPRQAFGRVAISLACGLLVSESLRHHTWELRTLAAWDSAGIVLLTLAWLFITRANAAKTARLAAQEDPGRTVVWVLVIVASLVSLFSAAFVLRISKTQALVEERTLVGLALGAVALSWMLTHTAYTLRYAHLYYRDDDEGVGGLVFPGRRGPCYFDFAYFSFTIGMCFQTSDVTIDGSHMRAAVLGHALLSFVYNTTILALALNLAFGMLG